MSTKLKVLTVFAAMGLTLSAAQAEFPEKSVSLVVPLAPGGPTDLAGRTIAEALSSEFGQTVVVENKTGGGGIIGAVAVKDSKPDGYTVLVSSNGVVIDQAISKAPRVDVLNDLEIVGIPLEGEMGLYVHPDAGIKTLVELVEFAKANPGKLKYSSAGAGTATHLEFERFKHANGLDIVHVPYKGGSESMTGTLSGQVELLIFDTGVTKPHVDAGKLIVLGTGGQEPSRHYPGTPTIGQALNQPEYTSTYWIGVFLPKGTDANIVAKYKDALEKGMKADKTIESVRRIGFNLRPNPTEGAREKVQKDLSELQKIVEAAKIEKR